ncbi:MAG: VCBS repeat-containing protein [Pseudomonadota bacterium]
MADRFNRRGGGCRLVAAFLFLVAAGSSLAQPVQFEDQGIVLPPAINGFVAETSGNGFTRLIIPTTDGGFVSRQIDGAVLPDATPVFDLLVDDAVLADFDGDGDTDFFGRQAATESSPSRYAFWFSTDDSIEFLAQIDGDAGDHALAMDINSDGRPDLVFASSSGVVALRNDGFGFRFTRTARLFDESVDGLAAGDIDLDGDEDLIAATRTGWKSYINQGGQQGGTLGEFVSDGVLNGGGVAVRKPLLVDTDGDRDLDLYIASDPFGGTHADTLWINRGGRQGGTVGQFSASSLILPDVGTNDVHTADADLDGDPDLLLANTDGLRLLLNQGGIQAGGSGNFSLGARLESNFEFISAVLLPGGDENQPTATAVVCCENSADGFGSTVKTISIENGIPDLSIDGAQGRGISMPSATIRECPERPGEVVSTRTITLTSAPNAAPRDLALRIEPPNSPIRIDASLVTIQGSQTLELSCDSGLGIRGVHEAALVIDNLSSDGTRRVPVSCVITTNCPSESCECDGSGVEGCCPFVCNAFSLVRRLTIGPGDTKALDEITSPTLLRAFRDGPMAADPVWNYYKMRFETMSNGLIETFVRDLTFGFTLNADQSAWVLALDTITQGGGDAVLVTPEMQASLDRVLDFVEENADAPLALEIARERERLGLDDIEGLTLREFFDTIRERGAEVGDIRFSASFE